MRTFERRVRSDRAGRGLADPCDLPVVLRLIPQVGEEVKDPVGLAGDEYADLSSDGTRVGRLSSVGRHELVAAHVNRGIFVTAAQLGFSEWLRRGSIESQ
jgi:hypothetical protein